MSKNGGMTFKDAIRMPEGKEIMKRKKYLTK